MNSRLPTLNYNIAVKLAWKIPRIIIVYHAVYAELFYVAKIMLLGLILSIDELG
jgi:hypothetical protein